MTKKIIQIIGIILFFCVVAYALTYPYELSYSGNEDIKLIEESYEFTSLEQVIDRPEFKGKVLYVRVWEPLEHEFYNYQLKKVKGGQKDYLLKVIEADALKPYVLTSKKISGGGFLSGKRALDKDVISFEGQLKRLSEMEENYKNENIVFVFLTRPDSDFKKKEDDLRKWKAVIKKFKIKGFHFVMCSELEGELVTKIKEIKENRFVFPHNFIIDKQGNIVNNNAASPSFEKEKLYAELDSILKQ